MTPRILLVDPRPQYVRRLQIGLADVANVQTSTDFRSARAIILSDPPNILVTNLRLQAYNGLHLVHLTALLETGTRSIVFADTPEPWLMREVQASGAFFERSATLPTALASYIGALLPSHERRDVTVPNRRRVFRGGRRSIDLATLQDLPLASDLPGAIDDLEKT